MKRCAERHERRLPGLLPRVRRGPQNNGGDAPRSSAEGPRRRAEARAARGPPAGKTVDPTKVFVTNLGHDESDYSLRGHCSSVGEVASVELLTRGFNGTQPTGSAVVQFYSAAAATAAIQDLNGTELNGRRLYVRAYFT